MTFCPSPINFKDLELGMDLSQDTHSSLPIWVKIFKIPLEGWHEEGIATAASALGQPIHADGTIEDRSRLGFTRVCVEINTSSMFPKFINLN